jgi:predicted nucleotidyltransferase
VQAPLWVFTPPHFCGCWNTSCSFIATAKTSYTTGTLSEIKLDIYRKIIYKIIMDGIKKIDAEIYDFIMYFKNLLLKYFNENIIGIYLFGSLTYGGFDKESSDIDIVVISKKLFQNNELDLLKYYHKELLESNISWSKRIEVSYTPLEMFKENEPPKIPRPYYNEIFYNEATYGNEWLINNYLLYNYGITIYGPEFKTLVKNPIDIKDVQKACIQDFYKEWLPKIDDDKYLSNDHYQAYVILNLCRILYTIINAETANKTLSAKWVKENYKQWNTLINEAEKWNYSKKMNRINEIKEFIKYSNKIIEEYEKKSNFA